MTPNSNDVVGQTVMFVVPGSPQEAAARYCGMPVVYSEMIPEDWVNGICGKFETSSLPNRARRRAQRRAGGAR